MQLEREMKRMGQIYGPLFLLARKIYCFFHRNHGIDSLENITELPGIFIGRHQNTYGPASILAWLPIPVRMWTFYKFMDQKTCFEHYATFTAPVRFGWPRWLSVAFASVMSRVAVKFNQSGKCIPVYRGTKEIMTTFRTSIAALKQGDSVLIMPEVEYTSTADNPGELYAGFVHLAQLYYSQTKKGINFYPVYPTRKDQILHIGHAITYNPQAPFREERDRICEELGRALSASPSTEKEVPI